MNWNFWVKKVYWTGFYKYVEIRGRQILKFLYLLKLLKCIRKSKLAHFCKIHRVYSNYQLKGSWRLESWQDPCVSAWRYQRFWNISQIRWVLLIQSSNNFKSAYMSFWILLVTMDNMVLCNSLSALNEHLHRKRYSFRGKKRRKFLYLIWMICWHIFFTLFLSLWILLSAVGAPTYHPEFAWINRLVSSMCCWQFSIKFNTGSLKLIIKLSVATLELLFFILMY